MPQNSMLNFFKPTSSQPNIQNDWIKEWTTDPTKGDKYYTGEGSGQGWYPIWKTESEKAVDTTKQIATDLVNPNSNYYKDYQNKLKGTLSAGNSTDSLLAFNKGMGLGTESSAVLANEQYEANASKISDNAIQATKDLYLSNTGNAINANNIVTQNAQFNQNINFQKEMYNKQKSDSILNNILGLLGGGSGTIAGNVVSSGGSNSSGSSTLNWLDYGSSWMDKQYGGK